MKTRPLALLSAVLALTGAACDRTPQESAEQQSAAKKLQPVVVRKAEPKAYAALSHDALIRLAQQRLQLPEPPSLGTGISITPRQPSVPNVAYLYMWRGSTFNPYFDATTSEAGQTEYSPNSDFRFGIYIRPTPGRATLINCSIYGVLKMAYSAQVFTASGSYIGDDPGGTISQSGATPDWTLLVPWDPQFADFGMFRLMLVPIDTNGGILTGCQIAPVL